MAGGAAAKRDMVQPRAAPGLQQFAGKMGRAADARGAVVHASGPPREIEILGERTGRHARMHDQHVGEVYRQAHRRDVGARVEARVLHRIGIDRQHAEGGHQDGVAVGRRAQHLAGGDVACRPPGLLSTRTERPALRVSSWARTRATISPPPPAAKPDQQPKLLGGKRLRPARTRRQARARPGSRPVAAAPINDRRYIQLPPAGPCLFAAIMHLQRRAANDSRPRRERRPIRGSRRRGQGSAAGPRGRAPARSSG